MSSTSQTIKIWSRLKSNSLGRWLFSKIICFKAPYFSNVSPRIVVLDKNVCEGYIAQQRAIQNHIGSVHAIALCNLAELCAGLMTDVSIPSDMRWIPKEMKVKYLQKAFGKIIARATPAVDFYTSDSGYEAIVNVSLINMESVEVFHAEIKMWVSKRS